MRFCQKIMLIPTVIIITAMPLTPIFAAQENVPEVTSEVLDTNDKALSDVLTNAADEETFRRKKMGLQVVGFLTIYAFIMWRVKKRIWKDVHKSENDGK